MCRTLFAVSLLLVPSSCVSEVEPTDDATQVQVEADFATIVEAGPDSHVVEVLAVHVEAVEAWDLIESSDVGIADLAAELDPAASCTCSCTTDCGHFGGGIFGSWCSTQGCDRGPGTVSCTNACCNSCSDASCQQCRSELPPAPPVAD